MTRQDALKATLNAYLGQAFSRAGEIDAAVLQQWLYDHEDSMPRDIRGLLFQVHNALAGANLYRDQK